MTASADSRFADLVKARFDFAAWSGRNTLEDNLFVLHFFFAGKELPGWEPHRIQEFSVPGFPDAIQSVWRRSGGGGAPEPGSSAGAVAEDLLQIDTFECASRLAAHEYLVGLAGRFQIPGIERSHEEVGDVAFIAGGKSAIVFARANLVHMIRATGRPSVIGGAQEEVAALADRLDAELREKPASAARAAALAGPARLSDLLGARRMREQQAVPLTIVPSRRSSKRVWYKIFSRNGEVERREADASRAAAFAADAGEPEATDELVYRPEPGGPGELLVFSVEPAGERVSAQPLHLAADGIRVGRAEA